VVRQRSGDDLERRTKRIIHYPVPYVSCGGATSRSRARRRSLSRLRNPQAAVSLSASVTSASVSSDSAAGRPAAEVSSGSRAPSIIVIETEVQSLGCSGSVVVRGALQGVGDPKPGSHRKRMDNRHGWGIRLRQKYIWSGREASSLR
jgi:hypothetical protein